jgi:hypothetical protein
MAHIRIVEETEARGSVAEDYSFLSGSYSKLLGRGTPTPQVYRTNSIVPDYFRFGAIQNRVLTNDGRHDGAEGPVPAILVMFAISMYSSCFY